MPNKKISQLSELKISQDNDEIAVVDKIKGETKKQKKGNFLSGIIRKLATVENIDLKTPAMHEIYTVPIGSKLVIIGMVIRNKNVVIRGGDGDGGLKRRSDDLDLIPYSTLPIPDGNESYTFFNVDIETENAPFIISAGDGADLLVNVPDTGTTCIVDVDLIGYLIEE